MEQLICLLEIFIFVYAGSGHQTIFCLFTFRSLWSTLWPSAAIMNISLGGRTTILCVSGGEKMRTRLEQRGEQKKGQRRARNLSVLIFLTLLRSWLYFQVIVDGLVICWPHLGEVHIQNWSLGLIFHHFNLMIYQHNGTQLQNISSVFFFTRSGEGKKNVMDVEIGKVSSLILFLTNKIINFQEGLICY